METKKEYKFDWDKVASDIKNEYIKNNGLVDRYHKHEPVIIFNETQFPEPDTRFARYGFSVYKNIFIQWDENHDTRVLTFIDEMADVYRDLLIMCHYRKGSLMLVWKNQIPYIYTENKSVSVQEDEWYICSSVLI